MKPVTQFGPFEWLWAYEGLANDPKAVIHYYGLTILYWFFGIVTVSLREDNHGRQK